MRIIKIKGCKTCKEVLIAMFRDEDSNADSIELIAWHVNDDGDFYQREVIDSGSRILLQQIIADFSEVAANHWANSMIF